jgi:hypothetical protein
MGGHEALWELAAAGSLGRPAYDEAVCLIGHLSGSKVGSWPILGGFGGILIEL